MKATTALACLALALPLALPSASGFSASSSRRATSQRPTGTAPLAADADAASSRDEPPEWSTARLPTGVDDQVRQAAAAIARASRAGVRRHAIRLLLPVIGATELDDWPGGARQMMQAADPLLARILQGIRDGPVDVRRSPLDASDGLYALMGQATRGDPAQDTCCVPLPSADNARLLRALDPQVGPERDFILCNAQWKRRADFGNFGIGGGAQIDYVERFEPTFHISNFLVDGDPIRILRAYPGNWRVFLLKVDDDAQVASEESTTWVEIGQSDFVPNKPDDFDSRPENKRDGGQLFNYGQPTYQRVSEMIQAAPGYRLKSYAERAAAAFAFIKDTL